MWIARDSDGLWLFKDKPKQEVWEHEVFWYGVCIGQIDSELLPDVTFDTSPVEVELKLKK